MADIKKTIEVIIGAVNNTGPGLKNASADLEKFSSQAVTAGSALTTFAAGAAVALGAIALNTIKTGAAMQEAAEQSGIAAEDLSRLKYVAEQSNASMEDLQLGIKFLSKSMVGLTEDGQDSSKLFQQLGVQVKNADGSFRNVKDVFLDTSDALSKMDSGTERVAYTTALFGRGSLHLAGVMKLGREEILRLGNEAARTGQVMSTEFTEAADAADDSMKKLKGTTDGIVRILGAQLIPLLTPMVDTLQKTAEQVLAWSQEQPGLAKGLLQVVAIIGGAGGLLLLLGALTGAFSVITPVAIAAWTAITGPVGILIAITAGVAALGVGISTLIGNYKDAQNEFSKGGGVSQAQGVSIGSPGSVASGTDPAFVPNPFFHGAAPAKTGGGFKPLPVVRSQEDADKLQWEDLTPAEQKARLARDVSRFRKDQNAALGGATGNRGAQRIGTGKDKDKFNPADTGVTDPGLSFQLSQVEEFALRAGEALASLPSLAAIAVGGIQQLGGAFGQIVHGLGAMVQAVKQWAQQMIASIISVIVQGLILRLVLSFIPGLGPLLRGPAGGLVPQVPGTTPSGADSGRAVGTGLRQQSTGPTINLNVGALMGSRGEAVELGRMIQRQILEFQNGARA